MNYVLPKDLIAQKPAKPRNRARLLVYERASGKITDDYFYNLDSYLSSDTTLAINDSAVEACRLIMGNTEIFILDELSNGKFRALVRPGRKFRTGSVFKYGELEFATIKIEENGSRIMSCNRPLTSAIVARYRHTPFPPYIVADDKLARQYQTVYAGPTGSKAAPTAGLHFTQALLKAIEKKHPVVRLTLHVGIGTFMNPTAEQFKNQKLHSERISLNRVAASKLNRAQHITAIGTTTLRTLETVKKPFKPYNGQTDLFILPGYRFSGADSLVTNFHLPGSSLLLLVAAFIGSEAKTLSIYEHAIKNRYRFYSFGDAMLIL